MSVEDPTSFELYLNRLYGDHDVADRPKQRRLHRDKTPPTTNEKESEYEDPRLKKLIKKRPPRVSESTSHGIMIDAGSQGTRLHVYEFDARELRDAVDVDQAIKGMKLTFPTTDSRWTNRLSPGLDVFAYIPDDDKLVSQVRSYLEPVLNFSKTVLRDKEEDWLEYPIYLKATGGLRKLPRPYRIRLIDAVRTILHDRSFNPFFFEDEHARVISGEEEAIYGWTAVNFVKGALIEASKGVGSVTKSEYKTYGVLEMGGASAQIGFFEPNGDTMANLFKLQIGAAKHWNVYVHSFLYFGVNSAYEILNAGLFTEATKQVESKEVRPSSSWLWGASNSTGIYNPCLPGGSQYLFSSRIHVLPDGRLLPMSSPADNSAIEAEQYSAIFKNDKATGDYDACHSLVQKLLRKDANAWCDFAHDRDCSFAGIYQPPIPIGEKYFGEFIATSNFFDVFDFLGLSYQKVTMQQVLDQSKMLCSMSEGELIAYNNHQTKPISNIDDLNAMCFRSVYVAAFLLGGVGFLPEDSITAVDVINGQKLGWALGSMLYEINTLPWNFKHSHRIFKSTFRNHKWGEQASLPVDFIIDFDIRGIFGLLAMFTVFAALKLILFRKRIYRNHQGDSRSNNRKGEMSALMELSSPMTSYSSERDQQPLE